MNQEEKEEFLKRVRLNTLRDVQRALAKFIDEGGHSEEVKRAAHLMNRCLGERLDEISNDSADKLGV